MFAAAAISCATDDATSPDDSLEAAAVPAGKYQNPLANLTKCADSDPRAFQDTTSSYYLYYPQPSDCSTGGNDTYKVFHASNPAHWTANSKTALSSKSVKTQPNGGFWSNGIIKNGSTYYLFYSLLHGGTKSIGVATAGQPDGPFADQGLVITGNASHQYFDPYPFTNGSTHFVYYTDTDESLWGQELDATLTNKVGNPFKVLGSTAAEGHQDWENVVLEHPMVFHATAKDVSASHQYYLLYNGSGGALPRYAVGYAFAASPRGPFTRAPAGGGTGQNPILHQGQTSGVYGPGSPSTFVDGAGTRYLMYRYKTTTDNTWTDRRTSLDVLVRNGSDQLEITPSRATQKNDPKT